MKIEKNMFSTPNGQYTKSKGDAISSIVARQGQPSSTNRSMGTSSIMDEDGLWCCESHGGQDELQSWRAWVSDLKIEIQLRRQARAMRLPSSPYQPQSALRLLNKCLIVVSIAVAHELPAFSVRRSVLAILPLLHLVLAFFVNFIVVTYLFPFCFM